MPQTMEAHIPPRTSAVSAPPAPAGNHAPPSSAQEGKTLESKRDLSSPGPVLRTTVAFANCSGGILLIEVEDGTRNVKGVADPLDIQERLANGGRP